MSQATAMVAEFDRAHRDVVEFVRTCSDADWRAISPEEGWPVGAVIAHIAAGYTTAVEWAQAYLAERQVTTSPEDIDAHNAAGLEAGSQVTRQEALNLLDTRARLVREIFSELTDEQLAISLPFTPARGREISLGQLNGVLVRHMSRHLTSARAAVSAG